MSVKSMLSNAARAMSGKKRAELAIEAIKHNQPITELSAQHNVSRSFLYDQKDKALSAINDKFISSKIAEDEQPLYYISVTKSWIKQFIICLALHCRGSIRGIQQTLKDMVDYHASVGYISQSIKFDSEKAKAINAKEDLSSIMDGAHDEMFVYNVPILTGTEPGSLYWYLGRQEESVDGETWGISLLELQDKGFKPNRVIADDGSGLRAGHAIVMSEIPCHGDLFHMLKKLMDMRRYFRNCLKSAISALIDAENRYLKAIDTDKEVLCEQQLSNGMDKKKLYEGLSQTIDTLISWLQHDVFEKAGRPLKERELLYDFIVKEFINLEKQQTHRIQEVRISLENQREQILGFVQVLDQSFQQLAHDKKLPIELIWSMCELLRCKIGSDNYGMRSLPLQKTLGDRYDEIEDAVIEILISTERTSCMVENLHSRIQPYALLRKSMDQDFIDLLRFYFNHTPFLRSEKSHRKNKTPAELLFGTPHNNWLEILGYKPVQRIKI